MEFKAYYYYLPNDPKKEAIDRVVALNKNDAISYFSDRKQMDEFDFIKLYNVEVDENSKSK